MAVRGEEALWGVGVLLACPETCKHKICSELWGENVAGHPDSNTSAYYGSFSSLRYRRTVLEPSTAENFTVKVKLGTLGYFVAEAPLRVR